MEANIALLILTFLGGMLFLSIVALIIPDRRNYPRCEKCHQLLKDGKN